MGRGRQGVFGKSAHMIWIVENPEAVKNFRLPRCRSAAHLILAKEIVHVERMAAL